MSITLDSNRHLSFLKQGLKCPYTQETFKHGDRIVFCGNCKCASSADAWDAYNKCAGCGSSNLGPDTIPEIKEFSKFTKPKTFEVKTEESNISDDTYVPSRPASSGNNVWVWVVAILAIIIGLNMCSEGSKQAPPTPAPPPVTSYNTPYTPSNNYSNTATYQESSGIKITMRDMCNDKHDIQYKFFNKTRSLVWPSNTEVWTTGGYNKKQTHSLGCERGDIICYGATAYPNSDGYYWGVNIDNSNSDNYNSCFTCGETKEKDISPGCPSKSVYNPIEPDGTYYLNEANLQYCYTMGKVGIELAKICKTQGDIDNIYKPFSNRYNEICGENKSKSEDDLANAINTVDGANLNYKQNAKDWYRKNKVR